VKALEAYNIAAYIASTELAPTHPSRLGIALNFAVYHYEILGDAEEACKIAGDAYYGALRDFQSLFLGSDMAYEATLLLATLKGSLDKWTGEDEDDSIVFSGTSFVFTLLFIR
jgi:hypothetical protein